MNTTTRNAAPLPREAARRIASAAARLPGVELEILARGLELRLGQPLTPAMLEQITTEDLLALLPGARADALVAAAGCLRGESEKGVETGSKAARQRRPAPHSRSKWTRLAAGSAAAMLMLVTGVIVFVAPGRAESSNRAEATVFAKAKADGNRAVGLPGGASTLEETYMDWRVACASQGEVKRCALTQLQQQPNGQRVMAVELTVPRRGEASGTLVLPFGLALDAGITLQIDELAPMPVQRFRTCLPAGCIVRVAFSTTSVKAMRAATALKVQATAENGVAVPLSVSLSGFAQALDRVEALSL